MKLFNQIKVNVVKHGGPCY